MISDRIKLAKNPLALNLASIIAGVLGVTFTFTLPGITFDSLSVFSVIIAVLMNKKRFDLIKK